MPSGHGQVKREDAEVVCCCLLVHSNPKLPQWSVQVGNFQALMNLGYARPSGCYNHKAVYTLFDLKQM